MAQYVPPVRSTDQVSQAQPAQAVRRSYHNPYAVPASYGSTPDSVEFSFRQTALGVQKGLLEKLKTKISATFGAKAF